MHKKLLNILCAGAIILPTMLFGAGCALFNSSQEKYETGVNINLSLDTTGLHDAEKVQIGYDSDCVANVYNEYFYANKDYVSSNDMSSITINDIYFSELKGKSKGYELKDIILYLNIKNYDDEPISLSMTAATESQDIELDCEQISYIQEVAEGREAKKQVAAFRVRYKNDISIKRFVADIDLNITLATIPVVEDSEGVFTYTYNVETKTAIVDSYTDSTGDLSTIKIPRFVENPEDIEGGLYTVTELKAQLFSGNSVLKNVYLPDTLTKIGVLSFYNTTALDKVYMADNIKYIGRTSFAASAIKGEVYLPQEMVAFTDIPTSVAEQPDAEDYVGLQTFYAASNVEKIVIPEGVERIPMGTFWKCTSLKEVIFPTTIKEFGSYQSGSLRGSLLMQESGIERLDLYNTDLTKIEGIQAFCNTKSLVDVYLPKNLKLLDYNSFYGSTLSKIVVPDTLEELGQAVFYNCINLTNITIPNSLKKMGDAVFGESGLVSFNFPKNIKSIPNSTFTGCKNLENITLKAGLKTIEVGAFQACHKLKNITIPSSVEFIGDYAFNHCYNLETEVLVLPAGIKQIGGRIYDPANPLVEPYGSHVFYNCGTPYLKAFSIAETNPYYMVVDGVLYRKENGVPVELVAYPAAKQDEVYIMPDSVKDAYELSLSRPYYLKKIVLSDSFVIRKIEGKEAEDCGNDNWANNLSWMIYVFCGVSEVEVKDTHPLYKNIGKGIYSKDGKTLYWHPLYSTQENDTITIAEGTEIIFAGALGNELNRKSNVAGEYFPDVNRLYAFKELVIPSSVTFIDEVSLVGINAQTWNISLVENTVYKVENGDIVTIAAAE